MTYDPEVAFYVVTGLAVATHGILYAKKEVACRDAFKKAKAQYDSMTANNNSEATLVTLYQQIKDSRMTFSKKIRQEATKMMSNIESMLNIQNNPELIAKTIDYIGPQEEFCMWVSEKP